MRADVQNAGRLAAECEPYLTPEGLTMPAFAFGLFGWLRFWLLDGNKLAVGCDVAERKRL